MSEIYTLDKIKEELMTLIENDTTFQNTEVRRAKIEGLRVLADILLREPKPQRPQRVATTGPTVIGRDGPIE